MLQSEQHRPTAPPTFRMLEASVAVGMCIHMAPLNVLYVKACALRTVYIAMQSWTKNHTGLQL